MNEILDETLMKIKELVRNPVKKNINSVLEEILNEAFLKILSIQRRSESK